MKHLALMIAALNICAAQKPPAFEVATVRKAAPGGRSMFETPPGRVVISNTPLRTLLVLAFEVPADRLTTPRWMETQAYDITASVPEGIPGSKVQPLLATLLTERFSIKLHHESKERDGYELIVVPGQFKLQPIDPATPPGSLAGMGFAPGNTPSVKNLPPGFVSLIMMPTREPGGMNLRFGRQGIAALADRLGRLMAVPIVDKTGLTGEYTFDLDFSTVGMPPPVGPPLTAASTADLPSLTRALQDMGLSLKKTKIMVDTIVVDSANQEPEENENSSN